MEKVTLVSGASRGLGLEVTSRLLGAGQRVGGFARNPTDATRSLQERYPDRFLFASVDLLQPSSFPKLVEDVQDRLGPLTGLVNNAGLVSEQLLVRQPQDEIVLMIDANLKGPLLLAKQAIRSMMIAGYGAVVNVSSIVSISGYKGTVAYSVAKAGLNGMTRSLARELGGRGITVNSVVPGYMETDLVASIDPTKLKQIVRRTPLGRAGTVDDVAGVVEFLLSDAARFITGQMIVVDGGLSA